MGKKPQIFERYCLPCVISIFVQSVCSVLIITTPPFLQSILAKKLSALRVYLIFFYFNISVESTLHLKGGRGGVKIYRNSENYVRISLLISNSSSRWSLFHSTSFALFIMSLSLVFNFFSFSRISPFLLFCLFVFIQFLVSQFL